MGTLYVTDLDGTLLNAKDRINPYSLDVINKLVEQGILFTYATARSLVSAAVVTAGLSTRIPVIVYNGAFIIKPATGEILASAGFEKAETEYVIRILQEHNISPAVYSYIEGVEKVSLDKTYMNEGKRRYLDSRKGDKRFRLLENKQGLYDGEIFYFTCIGEETQLRPVYEQFVGDDRYICTLQQELYRPEYWLEIMPKKATKAEAIQTLKKLWDCDRVVSFGDAINDIPMFQISDECYAVSNAVEKLKELATGVIESNEEDGVAKWLEKHVRL